jgi:formyltetrahydrofolate hydrolase
MRSRTGRWGHCLNDLLYRRAAESLRRTVIVR